MNDPNTGITSLFKTGPRGLPGIIPEKKKNLLEPKGLQRDIGIDRPDMVDVAG